MTPADTPSQHDHDFPKAPDAGVVHSDVIWSAFVDGNTWEVSAVRSPGDAHLGRLRITHVVSRWCGFDEPITVSHGAVFGPDVTDVAMWRTMAIDWIDEAGQLALETSPWHSGDARQAE